MPLFTPRHYVLFVDETVNYINRLLIILKGDNSKFNRNRFLRAVIEQLALLMEVEQK